MKKKISIVFLVLCMIMGVAKADFSFGTPTEVPNVNSSANEYYTSISADGLSLYINSNRSGGYGSVDIWVATRETTDDPWGTPVNLGQPINSPSNEAGVSISSDGLSLYFSSNRPSGYGDGDLWVVTRETIHSEWGTPMNLGTTVNSGADQCYPSISADELELYFSSNRAGGIGGYDIWVTKRATIHEDWGTPENLGPTVNHSGPEAQTGISADGRMLFFVSSSRPGGYGGIDIWVTSRATTDDDWGEPVHLGSPVNSSGWEEYPNVSADGSTLFFRYSQFGRWDDGDIWQAPIIPVVDFNGDGKVDTDDLLMLIENWGTSETLCDIGPMPWGDGTVDREDVEVLMSYWGQDIYDPTLIAHYKLDETEGDIAYDSAGELDGMLNGGPLWQPDGGMVDGAIEFDGIDDYISTDPVLNPEDGPFSVLVWIKGGAPGQSILSQADGVSWVCTDSVEGCLMTELKGGGRDAAELPSQVIITDGDWHRVGFVWDGSYRTLYVDEIEVAEDEQTNLRGSDNGLYIGACKAMEAGTYWSGLIDDVRIYNRVVRP